MGAFALLAAWIWLSNIWSESTTLTLLDGQRVLAYVAGVVFVAAAIGRAGAERILVAVAAAGTLVASYALLRYAVENDQSSFGEPIGYSNALAVFAAMAALIALGLVTRSRTLASRVAAGAALFPLAATIILASSRGALLALSFGVVVFVALSKRRRAATAAAAALALTAVTSLAVVTHLPEVAPRATSLRADVFTLAGHDRGSYWAAALQSFVDHPLLGSGAGTFSRMWLRYRDENLGVLDAHNLYLEVLSELGPIGLALLIAAFGVPLRAVLRTRQLPLVPAAAGAYCTFLAHAGVDWDWEMPVVTLAAILIGGYLVVAGPGERRALRPEARAAAFVVVLGLGTLAFVGLVANSALTAATVKLDEAHPTDAAVDARRAGRWALWSAEPSRLEAQALLARGEMRPAHDMLLVAIRRDRGDVSSWRLLAQYWPSERRRAVVTVARLDPRGPLPWEP